MVGRGPPLDPQTLLQQLQDMGLDVTLLQDLPPDKLQAIIDGVQQMLGSQNAENDGKQLEPDPNTVKDGAGFDDAFSFDDSDLPDAMDEAQAMDYSDKARKFAARAMAMMEKYCPMAKNADAPPPGTPLPGVMAPDTAPVNPMSSPMPPAPTQHPASVTMKYSEDPNFQAAVAAVVKAALGETQKEFAGIKKQASEYEANTRRANITKFCESMVEKGQLLPAQLDPGDPKAPRWTVIDRLFACDHANKVHKFREGGKDVSLTELELAMKEIETGPRLRKFGELLIKSSGTVGASDDPEKDKVQRFAESNAEFQTALRAMRKTPEEYVAEFEAAQKKAKAQKKTLTATQFGVPANFV